MGGVGQEAPSWETEAECAGQGCLYSPGCSKRMSILWLWSMVLHQCIASHSLQQGLRCPGSIELCSNLARNQVLGGPIRESQRAAPQTSGIRVAEWGIKVKTSQFSSLSLARDTASLCLGVFACLSYVLSRDLEGLVSHPSRCPESIFSDGVYWACNF